MTQRPGFFARLFGFISGIATHWIRGREEQNPQAVFENAITERVGQYRELKEAVAGILYMRNKLEGDLADRRGELARTLEDIRRSVQRGDDDVALTLIAHKQALIEDIERAETEFETLKSEAEEAKTNLVRFREEIRALEREKGRIVVTLANAKARRRIHEAIDGLSVDADMRALESVRSHVARLSTEGELDRELGADDDLQGRLKSIRREATHEAARQELEQFKRQMSSAALPARSARSLPAVPVVSQ
ncbi:MAG: PspA/IM30 family protein [Deltaproteobacteria bacterium]|nr:PspA/IM30 family protein [Deltaproteobacteria bacterium]MBW2395108.1 PspA/IM30 family protein [Deltaproteobacteria bacterium]